MADPCFGTLGFLHIYTVYVSGWRDTFSETLRSPEAEIFAPSFVNPYRMV